MIYKKNQLFIENVSALSVVKKYGSPTYCYSLNKLEKNILKFKNNFKSVNPLICFSVKSNNNLEILKIIKNYNLGADVVSKGELLVALKAKIPANKIVFSGVGKTNEEINFAIDRNILLINAESESEIKSIIKIANKKKKNVNIGIRLNPNVDALTNNKISTGRKIDKFGVDKIQFKKLLKKYKFSKYVKIKCLSVHIGSQITDFKPYIKMVDEINNFLAKTDHKFDFIDFGGGMGIQYNEKGKALNYKKYMKYIEKFLKKNDVKIILEPGRSIVGDSAILLSKIIYIKETKKINFIILDAGMNDLVRPALYGSMHRIIPLIKKNKFKKKIHNFVGPVCETTDQFLSLVKYYKISEGDYVSICDVGAYGMVLTSNYNLRTKPAEVIVDRSISKLITRRQKLKNII